MSSRKTTRLGRRQRRLARTTNVHLVLLSRTLRKALCAVSATLLLVLLAAQGQVSAADSFKAFKLKTLEGTPTSLPDVLGKATLIVFFYPTCPYCNAAFPEIQKLHDTYREQGLSIVWINVLPDEDRLISDWRSK